MNYWAIYISGHADATVFALDRKPRHTSARSAVKSSAGSAEFHSFEQRRRLLLRGLMFPSGIYEIGSTSLSRKTVSCFCIINETEFFGRSPRPLVLAEKASSRDAGAT